MPRYNFIPHRPPRLSHEDTLARGRAFFEEMDGRRSVRAFSPDPVPREAIKWAIRTASTAPSGAHRQPWKFVVVTDPAVKRAIRLAAEAEEREFYAHRAPPGWLAALEPLGTGPDKPFLETAPCLIAIFAQSYELGSDGKKSKNYYVTESVGIATGMLITALHHAGLATLTHTPSPMGFLNRMLDRPGNERPFLLLVVGFPAPGARVPDIRKKSLDDIVDFVR